MDVCVRCLQTINRAQAMQAARAQAEVNGLSRRPAVPLVLCATPQKQASERSFRTKLLTDREHGCVLVRVG